MTEEEAHKALEQTAMKERKTLLEIAESIIERYAEEE
jgi:AmiR/NasT family two-component response regulator